MITSISSLLFYANDLDKTFEFYQKLGFKPKNEKGMVKFRVNWFEVTLIDKKIAEIKKYAEAELKGLGMFVYIKVADVDNFYDFAVKKGIKPSSSPKDWPWGNREFVIKDPNGYALVFFNKSKKKK